MSFEGTTYGVPYAIETLGLFANADLTDVTNPSTIEEMIAAGEASGAQNILCLPIGAAGDAYHMQPIFTAGGGYIFGKNADGSWNTADIGLDSAGGLAAAAKISELGASGVLKTSITGDNSIPLFAEGNCTYLVSGPWALQNIQGVNYVLGQIPGFEGGNGSTPPAGVNGFYVASNGANKAFAQQFVTDVATDKTIVAGMFESNQLPPAYNALMDDIRAQYPDIAKFGELMANSEPMPAIPAMAAVWGPLGIAHAQVVDGADPSSTFTAAANEVRGAIG
jgi:arabinogalactan oligomer/maltooligosaccharide transport system substrate-binding protein